MLPHITTANTARDLDRIRVALGEAKVSCFGAYPCSVCTTMFPDRGDRFLLDNATGPGGWVVVGGVVPLYRPATSARSTPLPFMYARLTHDVKAALVTRDDVPDHSPSSSTARVHPQWTHFRVVLVLPGAR